jgi:uncharacterized protein with HEPN domain
MDDRLLLRIRDIKERIRLIRELLAGKTFEEVSGNRFERAAFERFLEIISEASRYLPEAWKAEHPETPWRKVADLGNVIRHAYDGVDLTILWDIYEHELSALDRAVDAMVEMHGSEGDPS